jgi:hypothetical protein
MMNPNSTFNPLIQIGKIVFITRFFHNVVFYRKAAVILLEKRLYSVSNSISFSKILYSPVKLLLCGGRRAQE